MDEVMLVHIETAKEVLRWLLIGILRFLVLTALQALLLSSQQREP